MIGEGTPIKIAFSTADNGKDGELFTSLKRLLGQRGHYIKTIATDQNKSFDGEGNDLITYDILRSFYEESLGVDCVLYDRHSPFCFLADLFVHKAMQINLAPDLYPVKPGTQLDFNKVARIFNRLSQRIFPKDSVLKSEKEASRFRKSLGLTFSNNPDNSISSIYGVSEYLLKKPVDYPINSYFTGLWINNDTQKAGNLNPLLLSDKKTVLIVLPKTNPDLSVFKMMIKVCNDLGLYSLVAVEPEVEKEFQPLLGEASMVVHFDPTDLIPIVDAVIYPVDVRLTMECLFHGKPSVSYFTNDRTPDQKFWTDLSFVNNCSLESVSLKKSTEEGWALKLNMLINQGQIGFRCRQIAAQLHKEEGLQRATQLIEMRFCPQFTFTKASVGTRQEAVIAKITANDETHTFSK